MVVVVGSVVVATGEVVAMGSVVVVVAASGAVDVVGAGSCTAPVHAAVRVRRANVVLRIGGQGTSNSALCDPCRRDRLVLTTMDGNEIHDVEENLRPEPPPRGEGIPWGAAFLLVWAALLIVFSVQNADITTVQFLGWSWEMPVALLVMVTALATLVLTGLGTAFYRRRRRKRRQMEEAYQSDD